MIPLADLDVSERPDVEWPVMSLELLVVAVRSGSEDALDELRRRVAASRYSSHEARDKNGRWTGPGMTGSAAEPRHAEDNLQSVLDRGKASGHFEEDRAWYSTAHDAVGERAARVGVEPGVFAGMVAATSPHSQWSTKSGRLVNIDLAEKAAVTARAHPGMTGRQVADTVKAPGMLKNSLANAVDIHNGAPVDQVLKGPKTRSFYNNLIDPKGTANVTIDTHMARAMANDHALSGKDVANYTGGKNYAWAADRVRNVAKANNLSPAEAQAAIWQQWRREG